MNRKRHFLNKKTWIMIRILFVFLPAILFTLYLVSPYNEIDFIKEKTLENETITKLPMEITERGETFDSYLRISLRNVLKIPLDINLWCDLCFVNKNTILDYGDSKDYKNVNASVNFNNKTRFIVPYKQTKCIVYTCNENFTYNWFFSFKINLSKVYETESENAPINVRKFTFIPYTDSYGKLNINSILMIFGIVLVAWCSIIWLSSRILKFIRYGIWNS